MKPTLKSLFTIGLASAFFVHCNQATESDLSTAPIMPRMESMTIPNLDDAGQSVALAKSSGLNRGLAALYVGYWTAYTSVALTIPVGLFKHLHDQAPVATADGWEWKAANATHSAVLSASWNGSKVKWTMNVSGDKLKNFTWFTGTSSVDGKAGDWAFNGEDGIPKYSFTYGFTVAAASPRALGDVRVEVIGKTDSSYGNYLNWSLGDKLNSFTAHSEADKETVDITTSASSGAGKAQTTRNGNQYCWDAKATGFKDLPCDQLVLP